MKKKILYSLLISFLLSLADVQAQQKSYSESRGISTFAAAQSRAPRKCYDAFLWN